MARLIDITGKCLSGEWGLDDNDGTGIPVLRTTNFTNEGIVNFSNLVTRQIIKRNIEEKYLKSGDILIEKSGGSDNQPVGRVIYFEGQENTYLFNNFTGLLRVTNQTEWLPKYIFYAMFANYQKGGTRPFENKTTGLHNLKVDSYIASMEIKELSYEQQVKIVFLLDSITRLISFRKQQLPKLDELVKSRFIEMFGDPKNNEKNWNLKTFRDICTVRQGLQIPIAKRLTQYEDDCYEYITVAYLHGSKEREYIKKPKESVICTEDDILMTRTGNTGMVVTNVAGVFHNNFFLIDFDRAKYNKQFLVEYLNLELIQAEIIKRAGTSTIPDLNHGDFYSIPIYEPPIDLQNQFATFVEQTHKLKFEVKKALEKLEILKKSLMQKCFE